MMRMMWIALAATLLLGIGLAAQKPQAAETLLQTAIKKEVVDGDLKGAIQQYEKIAQMGNRPIAAQALLQMAECYQKLRDGESRKVYERIVREFGDQPTAVATAKARLGGDLSQTRAVNKRLLCDRCDEAGLSPDSRKVVFVEYNGILAIRDAVTGRVDRLPRDPAAPEDPFLLYQEFPVLSPDMKQVVYHATIYDGKGGELRIAGTEPGSQARSVAKPCYCYPHAWFPDGRSVLVSRFLFDLDQTWQLARVSISDGAITPIKSLEWRWIARSRASLSPDGKYVAYSALAVNPKQPRPGPADPTDQHIWVLAVDGSGEREIVRTSGISRNPVWTPDGKHVLYVSDVAGGGPDLWSIEVKNGKEIGAPVRITPGIGEIEPLGVHGGSYYYRSVRSSSNYVDIVDAAKPAGDPKEQLIGAIAAWSPDGKSIALKRPHQGGQSNGWDLVVHSLETGEERVYRPNSGSADNNAPIWFHDSESILTGVRPADVTVLDDRGAYKVDLKTGGLTELRKLPPAERDAQGFVQLSKLLPLGLGARLSPDDRTIYFIVPDNPTQIVSMDLADLATGQERKVFATPGITSIALSPNGRTLAFMKGIAGGFQICTVSIDGSNFREVYSTGNANGSNSIFWSNDGRSIFFSLIPQQSANWDVMRVPADGSAPASAAFSGLASPPRDVSPDGSRFLVIRGEASRTEVWTIDNLISVLK